jgi:hypothetical protein
LLVLVCTLLCAYSLALVHACFWLVFFGFRLVLKVPKAFEFPV